MLINDIECPKKLYEEIKNNNVVVFVGAGVSMGNPTSLPNFTELVKEISKGTGKNFIEEKETHDAFLGKLQHDGIDVKKIASEILIEKNPKPNNLHRNIVNIFGRNSIVRIVTTNYDQMLETAYKENKKNTNREFQIYNAPALPLGNDFTGIVHLHGNQRYPKGMIITDADFGSAYMLEAYATRFLVKLFEKYSVIFIGYSYDDIVMKYLTRSLPDTQKGKRYIITDKNENYKWKVLGLNPIIYPENDHGALYKFIEGLASRAHRKMIAWKSLCAETANFPPPIDDETTHEILEIFEYNELVKSFLESLEDKNFYEWVTWLDNNKILEFLYYDVEENETNVVICDWLISNSSKSGFDELFTLILRHNNKISKLLLSEIVNLVARRSIEISTPVYHKLIVYIKDKMSNIEPYLLSLIIEKCYKRELKSIAWEIYIFALMPKFILEETFFLDKDIRKYEGKYKWEFDAYLLNKLWEDYFKNDISYFASRALNILIQIFEMVAEDAHKFNGLDNYKYYDCLFSDFEKQISKDDIEDIKYILSNIMFESLNEISSSKKNEYLERIKYMMRTKSNVLKKVAMISLKNNQTIKPDRKIRIVLKVFNVYDLEVKPELFRIIGDNFNSVSESLQDRILKQIISKIPKKTLSDKDSSDLYTVYNWFIWLLERSDNNIKVVNEYNKISHKFSGFKPRESPELSIYIKDFEWSKDESPITKEELKRMSYYEVIDFFNEFKEDPFGQQRGSKIGLLELIGECGIDDIDWVIGLMLELVKNANYKTDIWKALFRSTSKSNLRYDNLEKLLNIINKKDLIVAHSYDMSQFLESVSTNKENKKFILKLEKEILEILDHIYNTPYYTWEEAESKVTIMLNSTNYGIVMTILSLIACHEENEGIPQQYKELLIRYINSETREAIYCRGLLIGRYGVLYFRDDKWTRENIFPILKDGNKEKFVASWEGLLTFSPMIYVEIANYMHEYYLYALDRLSEFSDSQQKMFVESLAVLLVYSVDNPKEEFLPKLFEKAGQDIKLDFLRKILWILKDMSEEERNLVWDRWIADFFKNITLNIPDTFTDKELEAVLSWIEFSESSSKEIINYVVDFKRIKFGGDYSVKSLLKPEIFKNANNGNELKIKLLRYILECDISLVYDKSAIKEFYESIQFTDETQKEEIVELAFRNPCGLNVLK